MVGNPRSTFTLALRPKLGYTRRMTRTRTILVTSALPYANGSIHLGHLVEYIQTDIWVRFQRLLGNNCTYVCADDAHGTPIMISARNQGITPQALIAAMHAEHSADFAEFQVEFDVYSSTDSAENKALAEQVYLAAKASGYIEVRSVTQMYCTQDQMFLPDRFIRGECPSCHKADQYGDSCEHCSATYSPTELIDPKCSVCGQKPELRASEHYFFALSKLEPFLKDWLTKSDLRSELKNKLAEWFEAGLKDWDISRDAPYFGFQIPGTTDKYFYVWMDAPIGYMAATQTWCAKSGQDFDAIWKTGNTEIHHFIGKDILYFHAMFWPAMLHVAGFKTPDQIHVHGFLTVNGEKMSKSRGTFIKARTYLNHLRPAYLRYYYASKLAGTAEDLDLNMEDFVFKVNADVINKYINIASRTASIITKKCDGKLGTVDADGMALIQEIQSQFDAIAVQYDQLNFHEAMKMIMRLADAANKFINDTAPWDVAKTDLDRAQNLCTAAINAFRLLTILLKPVLPDVAATVETWLGGAALTWESRTVILQNQQIEPYQRLGDRIDPAHVEALLAESSV